MIQDSFPPHCFLTESLSYPVTAPVFLSKSLLGKSGPNKMVWRLHAMQPLRIKEYNMSEVAN